MSDQTVTLRVTADTSSLNQAAREAKATIADIGTGAQGAGSKIAAELNQAQSKIEQFAKSGGDAYAQQGQRTQQAFDAMSGAVEEFGRSQSAASAGTTLLRQSLALLLTPTGLVLSALAGMAILALGGIEDQRRLEVGLIATGNAAGTTAGQLRDMASTIGAQTGQYANAHAALATLVESGRVAGNVLSDATRASVALAEISGRSIEQAAGVIEQLADDPVKAVLKLNDSYHFLTLSVYNQIKALRDQGDEEAATALAMRTAADALDTRRQQIVDSAGAIERAWIGVKNAVAEAIDNMKQVGRTDNEARLRSAYADREDIDAARQDTYGGGVVGFINSNTPGYTDYLERKRTANEELIASLEKQRDVQSHADDDAARQTNLQDNALKAAQAIDEQSLRLDKSARKQKELNDLAANYAKIYAANPNDQRLAGVSRSDEGQFSGGDYDKTLASINERYGDHGKAAREAAKDVRELERAERSQVDALEKLDSITRNLQAKVDPATAAWDHYQDALEQIAAAAEQATAASEALGEAGASEAAIAEARANATRAATATYENESAAWKQKTTNILGQVSANAAYEQSLLRMTARERAFAEASKKAGDEFKQNEARFAAAGVTLEQYAAASGNAALATFDVGEEVNVLKDTLDDFGESDSLDNLVKKIDRFGEAIRTACDKKTVDELQASLDKLEVRKIGMQMEQSASAVAAGLTSMQSVAEEGSSSYLALEVAIRAANVVAAIGAILNQSQGDPYTAFARMAAMAAAVAQLVGSIGAFASSGFTDTAKERQASQGTGTVLGDADAKSESIANAVEITADATSTLVGLNRGMLNALQALQAGLGAAGGLLARGAGDADFSGMDLAVDGAGSGLFDGKGILGRIMTGTSKITDEGIIIFGGALNDLLESIAVGAYQEVQSRSWAFGSIQTNEGIVDVSDQFGKQFSLVIQSIADTVREGALALGLLPADVEAAMAAYRVEEIRISLKDLSAEEQQAELEAVFSSIFDGLAGAVVPFIGQFQKVGEGLGETLVRVATGVQVTQEAFRQLGITVDETDPERFAQLSEGLIAATGGIEGLIEGMNSFVANFASGPQQFEVASDALTSAFEQVGLVVPETREGMWALMQTLDATTESGREQIAVLLRLADVADDYYSKLEAQAGAQADYASFIADLNAEGAGLSTVSPFVAMRLQIEKWEQDTIRQANALARAAGLQGASEQDLTLIHEIAAHRIAEAMAKLMEVGADLVERLRGNGDALEDGSESASSAIGRFGSAMTDVAQAAQSAAQLLLGELSPLNDAQKLQYAIGAYQDGLIDKEAVLQVGRRLYASSQAYEDLFNSLQNGGIRPGAGGDRGFSTGFDASAGSSSSDADPDEEARQRRADAQQLAQIVASLANAQELSYQDVVATLDTSMGELAGWLGLSQDGLTAYLDNLVAQENAVPDTIVDGTNRIVAALYDIAGRPVPDDEAAQDDASAGDGRHRTWAPPGGHNTGHHDLPRDHTYAPPGSHNTGHHDLPPVEDPDAAEAHEVTSPPRGGDERPRPTEATAETNATLREVRTLLRELVRVTERSGAGVVGAVDRTVPVLVGVRESIDRSSRNIERVTPRGNRERVRP